MVIEISFVIIGIVVLISLTVAVRDLETFERKNDAALEAMKHMQEKVDTYKNRYDLLKEKLASMQRTIQTLQNEQMNNKYLNL